MDDTVLNLCLGEDCFNRCGKSGQIIRTGNENIFYAPVPQAVEHRCPEFGTLIFTDPHAQNIFFAVQIDTNGYVYGFFDDLPLTVNMIVDGIQENHCVYAFQRPLLPFFCDG